MEIEKLDRQGFDFAEKVADQKSQVDPKATLADLKAQLGGGTGFFFMEDAPPPATFQLSDFGARGIAGFIDFKDFHFSPPPISRKVVLEISFKDQRYSKYAILTAMVLRVVHNFFLYGLALIGFFWAVLFASCLMPFVKDRTRLFQAAGCIWVRSVVFFSGVKVAINGLENIPRGKSVILVANHQSAVDIAVLMAYPPAPFRFIVKKELFSIPVFGWSMRQAGHIAIDREGKATAYKTLFKVVRQVKSGESILIFPEGTRSRDGTLGKFKRGSLMIALQAGVPIVPLAISGSYKIMPPGTRLIRPGKVTISIGKPIYIENEKEYNRKLEEVREAIAGMLSGLP